MGLPSEQTTDGEFARSPSQSSRACTEANYSTGAGRAQSAGLKIVAARYVGTALAWLAHPTRAQHAECRLGGVVAAHAVNTAARRRRRRANKEPFIRRGIRIEPDRGPRK